jgi:hypothetical protein
MLTDNLWKYLQNYAAAHKAKGNGFGYKLYGPDDTTGTLSARYYKDGAEILMELANLGHIDSIEQLVYIFLDQKDFDDAESYINCAKDPNTPIILYLKARLIEERDGEEFALESFRVAAEHGSPNSILTMFNIAIEEQNVFDYIYFIPYVLFCRTKKNTHLWCRGVYRTSFSSAL